MDSSNYTSGVSTKDLQKARRHAKRKRVSVACTRCKSAKTKCSDYRPCSQCKKSFLADSCADGESSVYLRHSSPRMDFMVLSPKLPSRPTDLRDDNGSAFPQQEMFGDKTAELFQKLSAQCPLRVNSSAAHNLPQSVSAVSNGNIKAPASISTMITQANYGHMMQVQDQAADVLHHRVLHYAQSMRTPSDLMLQAQPFHPLPTIPYAPCLHPAWPSRWLLPTPVLQTALLPSALHLGGPPGLTPPIDALRPTLALAATAGAAQLAGPPPLRF
jgi:hypothetical protein